MGKIVVKNIMWDVDGVLANLDHAYHRFLTEHPAYKDTYKGLKLEDLPTALPISPKFGTLELTTHPTLGAELNENFCHHSGDIYFDRPLYPHVKEVLQSFNSQGYFQLTMSSGFNKAIKEKMIADTLGPDLAFVHIEVVEHAKSTEGQSKAMVGEKEQRILECLQSYNLRPEETVLVDDRIFNCQTALKVGMHTVRARWAISTPTPPELGLVEMPDILAFQKWVQESTTRGM
jgi:phosphoglycolate phosphatase-like HAD superfamily hydrolase